ncbi:MAG: MFS transporter [Anaerolineales bacterium]|nr:MFS transporter [Anaerolineales bacterium]
MNHSLITTLRSLRGNPRGCVYNEPLWGIPYFLYLPYVSIYMLALGLSDAQIGTIASISLGFQVIFALFGGIITDKLGRRLTTLVFDIISWTIPSILAAIAQNFWYFLIAGIINSVWRITHNSWNCLLVEDADKDQLVDIYTWIYIAVNISGFVAPVASLLVNRFTMVPTVRGLYIFAAIMFTVKAIITYRMTTETQQGIIRLEETRSQSIFSALIEYRGVFQDVLRTPQTLYTAGIMLVISITTTISNNFWSIIVKEKLLIPEGSLGYFQFVRSAVILFFFFVVMPRINKLHFKLPMAIGFLGFVLSQIIIIVSPVQSYAFIVANVIMDASCFAAVSPLVDKMVVLTVDPKERARIQSILAVGIIPHYCPISMDRWQSFRDQPYLSHDSQYRFIFCWRSAGVSGWQCFTRSFFRGSYNPIINTTP